jgi:protein tyrosine/serine phosphatase
MLVHCSAGKDRTGTFAALVLSLVGADDEDIAREYSLTEVGLAEWKPQIVEYLMHSGAFERREDAEKMAGARKEYMLGTMAMIRKTWGGAEGYLRSRCNLSSDEIEGVRRRLICEEVAALNGF